MKKINNLRINSRAGDLDTCQQCPRHPENGFPVFAEGCEIHQNEQNPVILFLLRDPSSPKNKTIIGCSDDSRVCPWCHTDPSANNFREKIYPLLSGSVKILEKDKNGRYNVYFLNSVFHGPIKNTAPPAQAVRQCSNVVRDFISELKPKVIVALGREAQKSLKWIAGIDTQNQSSPVISKDIAYFWSFHPGPQSFNNKKGIILKDFQLLAEYINQSNN
jgi:uracil-DNA glycosylase family 4